MEDQPRSLKCIVLRPDSWDDAVHIARKLKGYAFRGQMDSTWNLTTSLERLTPDFSKNSQLLTNREFWILKQFQRRAHHYISDPPSNSELIEWLSLIQHHGGPTRLLDFTNSFYVAAFFAVETAQSDAAIWAVNIAQMEMIVQEYVGEMSTTETQHHINRRHVLFANRCIGGEETVKLVLSLEPDRMNERMAVQHGHFLFPCDITVSFEENLINTFGPIATDFNSFEPISYRKGNSDLFLSNLDVVKIIIPRDIHAKIIDELYEMNISTASLFPGLDGFARSLRYHLRSLEDEFFK